MVNIYFAYSVLCILVLRMILFGFKANLVLFHKKDFIKKHEVNFAQSLRSCYTGYLINAF